MGIDLRCINKKCLYEWNHRREDKKETDLITCPKCHYRNTLRSLKKPLTHSQIPQKITTHNEEVMKNFNEETDRIITDKRGMVWVFPKLPDS